jgi:hypothetical protein
MTVTTGLPLPSLGKDADHYQALETENTPLPSPGKKNIYHHFSAQEKILTDLHHPARERILTITTQPRRRYGPPLPSPGEYINYNNLVQAMISNTKAQTGLYLN